MSDKTEKTQDNPLFPAEIADQGTGEVTQLPSIWQVDQSTGIRKLTGPRDWRTQVHGERGWFECNGEKKGDKTVGRFLNFRVEHGVLFAEIYKNPEKVIQAIFIDEDNIVSTIVFRTSSMENFQMMADNIAAKREVLPSKKVTMKMKFHKTGAGFKMYIVEFEHEPQTAAELKEMIEFVQANPDVLECFRELPRPGSEPKE